MKLIVNIFKESRSNDQRKIKIVLEKLGRIMKEQGLVSKYTVAQYKPTKTTCNESEVENVLKRKFDQEQELKINVSDLNYVCVFVDLYNREIIGYSAGSQKADQV